MQSGVGDLYNSKGVSTSAVAVADEVAEDEVIELKRRRPHRSWSARRPRRGARGAAAGGGQVQGRRRHREHARTLVGNASRDPGALVFHRNKDQKYATIYTELEKFFPGVCPELPARALDGTHPGDYGLTPRALHDERRSSTTRWRPK